jgi:hypothetical protein
MMLRGIRGCLGTEQFQADGAVKLLSTVYDSRALNVLLSAIMLQ